MAEYFYDKYKLIEKWDKNSSGAVAQETITSDKVTITYVTSENQEVDYLYCFDCSGAYWGYEVRSKNVHGFADHYLALSDYTLFSDSHPLNAPNIYEMYYGGVYGGFPYMYYRSKLWYVPTKKMETIDTYEIYKHQNRGELLEEDIILNHTYPVNGAKNGYWWIRKGKYTIPAPAIISPDNSFEVNKKDGDDMPYLVFQLTPRESNDQNLYHVRVRLGFRSDFATYEIYLESKEDITGWEYYNDSIWQPFPSGGVSANTKVRIKTDVESFEFGFHYWDCTAYNPQWAYGVSSEYRMIIVLDETDGVYVLVVNGIQYNAINLKISESSNGETGSINIVLSNHNI